MSSSTLPIMDEDVNRRSRVLIFTPNRRDCEILSETLWGAGFEVEDCRDADHLSHLLGQDALALITTEEVLRPPVVRCLRRFLDEQPVWSDFPIIVFTGPGPAVTSAMDHLGPKANVALVDRPVRMKSVKSLVAQAARARFRQFEVRDLLAKLEDRIAERDRFLAVLGHELRNPLGAIVLAAQMVDSENGTLDSQHAQRIDRQARHLSSLVDDLLDLSRITTGKITLRLATLDMNQIVEQCIKSLQTDRFRRDLGLTFHPSPEPLLVQADELRLEQIVSNLLTNAHKYTPEGGTITITTTSADGHAVLSVADTGVGIAPERIESIFELFNQAENAIGRSQGGMGIGLNLVRNLVELHGGSVHVRSDGVDRGSTFTVKLPVVEAREHERTRAQPHSAEVSGTPHRIVIVDDNADIRDLLQIKLRKLGHAVETAADGQTGLQRIMALRPDVAIIDIGMPGIDGYELARRIRKQLDQQILLIALTGFGQLEDKEKAAAAGFDVHLTKPIRVETLQKIFSRPC
jgi:signal transduction histidine kinase